MLVVRGCAGFVSVALLLGGLGVSSAYADATEVGEDDNNDSSSIAVSNDETLLDDELTVVEDTSSVTDSEESGSAESDNSGELIPVEADGVVADDDSSTAQTLSSYAKSVQPLGTEALAIINAERAKYNLAPIQNNRSMFNIAAAWSRYMKGTESFIHMYQVKSVSYQYSFATAAGWSAGGDLLGKGYSTEASFANGLLNSSAHRAWLMNEMINVKVAGVARSGNYWTLYLAGSTSKNPDMTTVTTADTVGSPTTVLPDASTAYKNGAGTTTSSTEPEDTTSSVASWVTVSGNLTVGSILTMTGGYTNRGAVDVSYQWKRGSTVVGTSNTYKLTGADRNKVLTATYIVRDKNTGKVTSKTIAKTVGNYSTVRLSGDDRYSTNLAVNKSQKTTGKVAFIVTGQDYPDALSIGPVVGKMNGNLYLTTRDSMSTASLNDLKSRNPSKIYIIGGSGVVSDKVVNQVAKTTGMTPTRISGGDRYSTSLAIANYFFSGSDVTKAFIATGKNFPDALSASAAGGALNAPVLLVDGNASKIDNNLRKYLSRVSPNTVLVSGGSSVVSNAVASSVGSAAGATVKRLGGDSRYDTNVAVNEYVNSVIGSNFSNLVVATGKNFPDALSSTSISGNSNSRLVLSTGKCVPSTVVSKYLYSSSSVVNKVTLVGGASVLPSTITKCS